MSNKAQRGSLSQLVLGVGAEQRSEEVGVNLAYQNLTGHDALHLDAEDAIDLIEAQRLAEDLSGVFGSAPLHQANVLNCWPIYSRMMQRYGRPAKGQATALLLGSANALTSRAFVELARVEYGANRAVIIDLESGRDKLKHGTFVYGDALRLPFARETDDETAKGVIDFAQTNLLLQFLDPGGVPWGKEKRRLAVLAREVFRVLKPGGQLLMYESASLTPKYGEEAVRAMTETSTLIHDQLEDVGFADIVIEQCSIPKGNDYFFDRRRNFEKGEQVWPLALAVFARKRPES